MRIVLVYILLSVYGGLFSQTFLPVHYDTTNLKQAIDWRGYGFYHSSALRNDFSQKILRGGMITDEIKDKSREGHDVFNRAGGDISSELTYFNSSDNNKNLGWWLRLGSYNQFAIEYSGDTYDLAMYGNSAFVNKTANLSNTDYLFMQYQKIGGGIFNPHTKNSIGLNIIFVSDYERISVPRGSLFTSETTGLIDLDLFAYTQNASAHTYFQGLGAALDFDYYVPIKPGGYMDGFIHLTGRNLGVTHLNELSEQSVNGRAELAGFTFDQIRDLQAGSWSAESYLDSLNYSQRKGSKWVALPGFVQVGKVIDETNERKSNESGLRNTILPTTSCRCV